MGFMKVIPNAPVARKTQVLPTRMFKVNSIPMATFLNSQVIAILIMLKLQIRSCLSRLYILKNGDMNLKKSKEGYEEGLEGIKGRRNDIM